MIRHRVGSDAVVLAFGPQSARFWVWNSLAYKPEDGLTIETTAWEGLAHHLLSVICYKLSAIVLR